MIRIRLLTMNDHYKYESVSHACKSIIKSPESYRGLYRGALSYFVNLVGVYSLNITIYELMIDDYQKRHGLQAFKAQETKYVLEASIISAIFTVLLTNFLEVIVVRRQSGSR